MSKTDQRAPSGWGGFIFVIIVAGVFATIGTGFANQAYQGWSLASDAPSFSTTQGKITRASVRSEGQDQVPDVQFDYTVKGEHFQGSNKYTANSYRDGKFASREANKYKVNQKVEVFYDPSNPERSVLTRKAPTQKALIRTLYAIFLYGVALFSLGAYVRSRKRARVLAYAKQVERRRQAALEEERSRRSDDPDEDSAPE